MTLPEAHCGFQWKLDNKSKSGETNERLLFSPRRKDGCSDQSVSSRNGEEAETFKIESQASRMC